MPTYMQSVNVSQTKDCVDVRTMSFDAVNVNDEVLRDGKKCIGCEGKGSIRTSRSESSLTSEAGMMMVVFY